LTFNATGTLDMSHSVKLAACGTPLGAVSEEREMSAAEAVRTDVRPCREEDLARIAEIHRSQLREPGALLGQLSPALIAALYAAFLDRSIFLVHASDGLVDGFVLGGSPRAMLDCRLAFFRKFALSCLANVVRRPRLWPRVFRSLVKLVGKCLSSVAGALPREEIRLLAIAVAAGATRRGVGTALVECFEEAVAATSGTYSLNVLKTNSAAIRFYEKSAFRYVGETAIAWTLRKELAAHPGRLELPSP
jgi:ribosomal protein S18 acetylase RimI-like enzyme